MNNTYNNINNTNKNMNNTNNNSKLPLSINQPNSIKIFILIPKIKKNS